MKTLTVDQYSQLLHLIQRSLLNVQCSNCMKTLFAFYVNNFSISADSGKVTSLQSRYCNMLHHIMPTVHQKILQGSVCTHFRRRGICDYECVEN